MPSLSPAAIPPMLLLISMALGTESTGITHLAPLYNAAAIVEVALNTSIITTTLLLKSYRFNNAGEMQVWRDGLLLMVYGKNNGREINGGFAQICDETEGFSVQEVAYI
jgi:hypothetical protein